jgi:hypothetical protein
MKIIGILIAASAFATGAMAQDAATDAATTDDRSVMIDQPNASRVYGWSAMRPIDYGTFHYWNGERCADARVEPPTPR